MVGESDADTDTDTGEVSGREALDMSAVASMPDAQQIEQIYWAYRSAERVWRRTTRKGTRKFRRHAERSFRRGKGRGEY
eukprot:4259418-Lingulodinium_polyedra.AAC.1